MNSDYVHRILKNECSKSPILHKHACAAFVGNEIVCCAHNKYDRNGRCEKGGLQ